MIILPLFSHVGPPASALHVEPPEDFLERLRPTERQILVRLEKGAVGFRDATVVGTGGGAFGVLRAQEFSTVILCGGPGGCHSERVARARYDVVHVVSGLRAWRARSFPEALQDAALLAWLDAWETWVDRPGQLPTPPAVTAYLGATGGRYDLEIPF